MRMYEGVSISVSEYFNKVFRLKYMRRSMVEEGGGASKLMTPFPSFPQPPPQNSRLK